MRFDRATVLFTFALLTLLAASCGDSGNSPDGGACSPSCGANQVCNSSNVCECAPFTVGDPLTACTPDCSGITCTNGTCSVAEDGPFCNCQAGWTGDGCNVPVNACLQGTRCMNGGTCVSTGPNSFQCDCTSGFVGTTCQTVATGCATRPCGQGSCTPGSGSAFTCVCDRGYGPGVTACNAPASSCLPEPCANSGACLDPNLASGGSDYGCTCVGAFEGRQCEVPDTASTCGAYVDVVYRISGSFRVADTPLNLGNVTKTIGANAMEPQFAHAGVTSPFPTTSFSNGHIRLRFRNSATGSDPGVPGDGPVHIVEWYVPIEFDVTGNSIPTVRTNVDHSAGLIALPNRFADYQQTLSRTCEPVADGTLAGTTLTWGTCNVMAPMTATDFTSSVAQADASMNAGCLRRTSSSGNTRCVSGSCALVPNISVGDQRNTWDQPLKPFVFSSSSYATATFSMGEIQLPNDTGTTTYLTITSATPSHSECSATPTCDEECDADSCQ